MNRLTGYPTLAAELCDQKRPQRARLSTTLNYGISPQEASTALPHSPRYADLIRAWAEARLVTSSLALSQRSFSPVRNATLPNSMVSATPASNSKLAAAAAPPLAASIHSR